MPRALAWIVLALGSAGWVDGEPLRVVSELQRVDPFGQVVAADRGAPSRHILSPGVIRNAYASFRIVVTLDAPGEYTLDVGQNPEKTFRVDLYKERFEKIGANWYPDGLEKVALPVTARLPDSATQIEGQTTATYWMDVWVSAAAPVDRIKVEPQLYWNDDWYTYPMEVRVLEPVIRGNRARLGLGRLPPVEAPVDQAVLGPVRAALCGTAAEQPVSESTLTARRLVQRNAAVHMALNRAATQKAVFVKARGIPSLEAWCATDGGRPPGGPEWYLRFRDLLFLRAGDQVTVNVPGP